jgi:hypothetical protein
VGAFGLYLLFRFHKSGEMDDCCCPNFGVNKEWYDIKILTDGTRADTTKEIQRQTYTDLIQKVFKLLLKIADHFGHFGRVVGPVDLEFKEISPEFIRILGEWLFSFFYLLSSCSHLISCFHHHTTGNWDPKTQESCYLAKMPAVAMQAIVGFEKDERYSLPCCRVEPPESLKRMLFPFIETKLEKVCLAVAGDKKERPTAVCTLQLWSKLRSIILQDAVVFCLQHPSGMEHPVFRMPVFTSPEFLVSSFCFLSTVDC